MAEFDTDLARLTDQQRRAVAADYLGSLEQGFLPYEIFTQLARLMVLHTVEVGLVKMPLGLLRNPQILLAQRPDSDEHWAGQWHVPGSVVRADDPVKHEHDYDAAISRVLAEVGGDVEFIDQPREFQTVRRKGPRGSEVTVRFVAQVTGMPERGRFFDLGKVLDRPPQDGLLPTHAAAIKSVATAING